MITTDLFPILAASSQLLSAAPSGVVLCSFGTVWYPSEDGVMALLAALRRLAPLKVLLKVPTANQQQLSPAALEILANAPNIVALPWLPQVMTFPCRNKISDSLIG